MLNHRFYLLRLIAIPLLIFLGSCFLLLQGFTFLTTYPAPETLVAHGHYTSGFERSFFQACHSSEVWAIRTGNLASIDAFKNSFPQESQLDQLETVYVEWRGILTRHEPLGILGAEFRVLEVLSVRWQGANDCQEAPAH